MRRPAPRDEQADAAEIIRFGTIETVDLGGARCTVRAGDIVSGPVRWLEVRAGATRTWSPPSVGEQVLLLCPEGELAAGVALRGVASDANPPPGSTSAELIRFADGTVLAYDPEAHTLAATLCAGGTVAIVADGGVTITGPVSITGNLSIDGDTACTGTIAAETDVVAAGISGKSHIHGQVKAGSDVSGKPQ